VTTGTGMIFKIIPSKALWLLLALSVWAISLPVLAQDKAKKISFLAGFESKTGGDDVGELVVNDIDKGDVEAGGGMHFYLGMLYKPSSAFETRLTAGYHLDRSPTDTGTVYMDRYPFELVPTYCYRAHRFGLGLIYHTNIVLHGDDFDNPDINFEDSLGYSVEYGYKVAPFLYLGFRYVNMFYDIENEGVLLDGGQRINASNFGINLYLQY
jgi:hypothetical protein